MRIRTLALLATAALAVPAAAEPYRPMKALMLVGGGFHDYQSLPIALADRLTRRGEMSVEVNGDWASVNAKMLKAYRVLIVNNCERPQLTGEYKSAIEGFVRSGGGLVVMHCSLWSYPEWPEWTRMMGGRVDTHDKYGTYGVVVLDPSHATMLGIGNRFTITDEPYLVDRREPDSTVLVETAEPRHDTLGKLRDGPDPQVWVRRWGQGRVFVTTFGHDAASQENESFMSLLHNGIRWAGGGTDDTVHNALTKSERQVGYELLFDGRSLGGFEGAAGQWLAQGGELLAREKISNPAFVFLEKRHGDFLLKLSFRVLRGRLGVLVRAEPLGAGAPVKGYEVQLGPDTWGRLARCGGGSVPAAGSAAPEALRDAIVPRGWNDLVIEAVGPEVGVTINGLRTASVREAEGDGIRSGRIGLVLPASAEPLDVRLRDVRIRDLPAGTGIPGSTPAR
jgi:type 1 glutamine amidotransferase